MSNINNLLMADEKIAFSTKKNLIIFTKPIIWTIIALFFFTQRTPFLSGFNGLPLINSVADLAWIPGIIALLSWIYQALIYLTSNFVITDRRVIMREGFFLRHSTETRLSAIAEIKVVQPLLGQVFNFGTVTLNSFGGNPEVFELITAPYQFQKKVSEKIELAGNGKK